MSVLHSFLCSMIAFLLLFWNTICTISIIYIRFRFEEFIVVSICASPWKQRKEPATQLSSHWNVSLIPGISSAITALTVQCCILFCGSVQIYAFFPATREFSSHSLQSRRHVSTNMCHLQALNYPNASVNFELRNTYLRRIIWSIAVSFVNFCNWEVCYFHNASWDYHNNELSRVIMLQECKLWANSLSFLCNVSLQEYW